MQINLKTKNIVWMEHHNRKVRDRLSRYLKNKRVVVVGPAASIIDSKQCELINSYDVVVRLNKALPVPGKLQKDIGTRTDILYNCMNPSEECGGTISVSLLKKKKVKFLIGAFPPVEKMGGTRLRLKKDVQDFFGKNRMRYNNFCYTDKSHFQKLWKQMKLPNTGVMAISDLLRFEIKELYITGITFFKGGYYSQYRNYDEEGILEHMDKVGLHKPAKELRYMAVEFSKDPRVVMDDVLHEIVAETMEIIKSETSNQKDITADLTTANQKEGSSNGKTKKETELSDYSEGTLERMSSNSVSLYTK